MATETEYVDAGEAVDFRNLSPGYVGTRRRWRRA